MTTCALLLICAILLDRLIGDPTYPWHPVRLIGRSIRFLETAIRETTLPDFYGGALLTLTVLLSWEGLLIVSVKLTFLFAPLGYLFSLFVLYSCIAHQDLARHALPVKEALERGEIEQGRQALQKIVGRDTRVLDETGIIRATIETIAEGFVDGFLSPIFYFSVFSLAGFPLHNPCLLGLIGAFGYRIINTLDSMIGYKSVEYLHFGRFAARLDDLVNFIPARLSILFLFLTAYLLKLDAEAGLEFTRRYRRWTASPNAGYPESFVAGALHVQLGGPVQYPFGKVDKPFIGNGKPPQTVEVIPRAVDLILFSGYLATALSSLFLWIAPAALILSHF